LKGNIGNKLAELRKAKKYLQKDVAAKLANYGIQVTPKTIYNWEKGIALPNASQFLALCDILGVDDVMWDFAGVHKGPYAGLNQAGRAKAHELIDLLFNIPMFRDDPAEQSIAQRRLRLYDLPASAGSGSFLDESSYVVIDVPPYVPASADFALRVSGDSMEPLLQDGQLIYVSKQQSLEVGEVGIFVLNGDSYVKKLGYNELISLNTDYGPIAISELDVVHVLGKVVG